MQSVKFLEFPIIYVYVISWHFPTRDDLKEKVNSEHHAQRNFDYLCFKAKQMNCSVRESRSVGA